MSTYLPIDKANAPPARSLMYVGALDSETVSIYCSDLKSRAEDWVRIPFDMWCLALRLSTFLYSLAIVAVHSLRNFRIPLR